MTVTGIGLNFVVDRLCKQNIKGFEPSESRWNTA